jgi:aminoglycoside N3'-acetyltransferase
MKHFTPNDLTQHFVNLGVQSGDMVLIRAAMGSVGRFSGGASAFVQALLEAVGAEGTVVSLAFTDSAFMRKPQIENAFTPQTKSYAGALPNAMLQHPDHYRSAHPMCSYVAIGRHAAGFTRGHDAAAPAYEPIRKLIAHGGKCMLVGCVASSPGFTTTHLAEADLGLLSRVIFPWLNSTYYRAPNGEVKLFRRMDSGLCSQSFYKFYAHYVSAGVLRTGFVGNAYSILVPAAAAYNIEHRILASNPQFNVCDSKECPTCNARRWDRLHKLPGFAVRRLLSRLKRRDGTAASKA